MAGGRISLADAPSVMELAAAARAARARRVAPGWMEQLLHDTNEAIRHLRARGILVGKRGRDAEVPRYRATGIDQSLSAIQVQRLAKRHGWRPTGAGDR